MSCNKKSGKVKAFLAHSMGTPKDLPNGVLHTEAPEGLSQSSSSDTSGNSSGRTWIHLCLLSFCFKCRGQTTPEALAPLVLARSQILAPLLAFPASLSTHAWVPRAWKLHGGPGTQGPSDECVPKNYCCSRMLSWGPWLCLSVALGLAWSHWESELERFPVISPINES